MKFYIIFVFMLYWSSANSTFWYKNDFERVVDAYRNDLSKDYFPYLRALSIFKRKLQLLGFYPIVSTNDGLEYVSLDAYIIEDDYDDRMYELLKKMKKEKKSRRKLSKKKMKKLKKKISTPATTAKPITNIVYYWPSTLISNPYENGNGYQQSSVGAVASSTYFPKKPYYEESKDSEEENSGEVDHTNIVYYWPSTIISNPRENGNQQSSVDAFASSTNFQKKPYYEESEDSENENSGEVGDIKLIATHKFDQNNRVNEFDKTVKTENENGLDTQRKLEVVDGVEVNNSESLDQSVHHTNVLTKQESGKGETYQTSVSSVTAPSATTQHLLLTVFTDPDEVVIQEILDQQDLINKISVEEQGNLTANGIAPTTEDVFVDEVEVNNSESLDQSLHHTNILTKQESGKGETNQASVSSTTVPSTTTQYPLLTVFPDPDEVLIQEILDQQDLINKISVEEQENLTANGLVPTTEDVFVDDVEVNNSESLDQSVHHTNVLTKQESGKGETNQASVSSTTVPSTTTQYPLLTVFPDPNEVLIQEILDQQDLINKISVEEQENLTANGVVPTTEDVFVDDVEVNDSKLLDQSLHHTNVLTKQESGKGETNQTSVISPTTTEYPLLTVFPDPDEVLIQEILDQQDLINKISVEEQENLTANGVVPTTEDVFVDEVEVNNSESLDQSLHHTNILTKQESGKGETNQASVSSTTVPSTTTQYPLLTVFPDPDEVVIQEILDQQELINKISVEEQGNLTVNGTVLTTKDVLTEVEDDIELNTTSNFINPVEDNLSQLGNELHQETIQTQTGNLDKEYSEIIKTVSESESMKDLQHRLENELSLLNSIKSKLNESKYQSTGSIVQKDKLEPMIAALQTVLDIFRDTLPEQDEHFSTSISSNHSNTPDNISVSDYNPKHPDISSAIPETTETTGGYLEIVSEHNDTTPQVNEPTTSSHSITQTIDEDLTSVNYPQHPHTMDKTSETTATIPQASDVHSELNLSPQSADITEQSEAMQYQTVIGYLDSDIDPKELNDTFESRGLTDMPMLTVTSDDKNGRSDVAIEPDDFFDDDTTDNLPYNLSSDNLLEQSNVIENVSAETSTELPAEEAINLDTVDQIDTEIIPLIPIILKQMKQGNVNPEEMEILKATFGKFWPIILEEANRDSDSSEEMNPLLRDVLRPIHRRVVKREATFGRFRRPIIGRRIYYDDDVEYVYPRRYLGRRRRPAILL